MTENSCEVCGDIAERHHIKTRGAGGTDEPENILEACRAHHIEVHKLGLTTFAEKYPKVKKYLLSKGWYFDDFRRKWRRDLDSTS